MADDERCFEFMLNALRLAEGVDRESYSQRTGKDLDAEAGWHKALGKGLVEGSADRIVATALGFRYLNDTLACFQG